MQLVTLKAINNFSGSCCCCGQDFPYTISADDNDCRSSGTYCFLCFQYLNAIPLLRSHRALT